jgi:hypothetical protein
MNFDYYSTTPFLVSIVEEGGSELFLMAYLLRNIYVPTVGINEAGLFASTQLLYHSEKIVDIEPRDDSLFMYKLFAGSLARLDRVSQLREIIATRQVVDADPYRPTHNLFADPTGDAVVVEAIGGKTLVTEVEHGFLVMTNFPNGRFAGRSYDEVYLVQTDTSRPIKPSPGARTRLGFRRPWQSCMTPPSHTVQCVPPCVHWCSIRLATMCMWFCTRILNASGEFRWKRG